MQKCNCGQPSVVQVSYNDSLTKMVKSSMCLSCFELLQKDRKNGWANTPHRSAQINEENG